MAVTNRPVFDVATRRSAVSFEERDADESIKQAQREYVLKHILKHHHRLETIHLLSLPDEHWMFERQLEHYRGDLCGFMGLQWSWATLERSVPWMPGEGRPVPFTERLHIGEFQGYERARCKVVFCHAGGFLRLNNSDIRPGRSAKNKRYCRDWARQYRSNTACWLDFNSQLCTEVSHAAGSLFRWFTPNKERAPVVISFMAARDDLQCDNRRVARLISWIGQNKYRRFVLEDVGRHQSAGAPYLSVAGFMRLTTRQEIDEWEREHGRTVTPEPQAVTP